MSMLVHGVIPARYESSRFPGKPLALIGGKTLVQHVYERARSARRLSRLLVATDDERIVTAVEAFRGEAVMTRRDHRTGTDRLAEVARRWPADIHVNIQGDEPLLDPGDIDRLIACLESELDVEMATLCKPMYDAHEANDPNVVKVVCDAGSRALYFSRSAIPFRSAPESAREERSADGAPRWLRHIGIYAYRHAFLLEFSSWPRTALEETERLEQLRAMEHGRTIRVLRAHGDYRGVDTPEDVAVVESALESGS